MTIHWHAECRWCYVKHYSSNRYVIAKSKMILYKKSQCLWWKQMLHCKKIHGNDRTGVIDFHGDFQCVMRVLLKVTWIQWPLRGEKVSLHETLKEHLVPKLWWWTGQVCYKLNCTTHLSSAMHALQGHVNPMTPLKRKGVTIWKA